MGRSLKKKRKEKKKKQILIWTVGLGILLIVGTIFATAQKKSRVNPELIEVEGRPALKVDQELIDFGYQKWNTNLNFALTVTNVGDKPLRFSETPYVEVREGC